MEQACRRRVMLLVLAVTALTGAIGGRLYQLQVHDGERWGTRAHAQHRERIEVPATRGAVVDRNGEELAVSLAAQSLFAHAWRVENPRRAAHLLAPHLELSEQEILQRLSSKKNFVYLDRFLDPEGVAAVQALDLPIGDNEPFGFLPTSRRHYPRGELAVHVIGATDIDSNGVEGIERQFNEALRGDPQRYLVLRDARAGRILEQVDAPPRPPTDVVLTIDAVLQHVVERELERAMHETGARSASAILLDPVTGQVLALANRPAPDANRFGKADADTRRNRAVTDQFEPGSTFKAVALAAALEAGAVRPEQTFDCEQGRYRFARRWFHDSSPHGVQSVREILQTSSNIGMIKISRNLDDATLWRFLDHFGFGARTGIELPGESRGTLRPLESWTTGSRATVSFGQEIAVTSLQLASAFATIANDGVLAPPRIVLGRRDENGRMLPLAPAPARRVISHRTAHELASMLEDAVDGGTGRRAILDGYRVAGKTGTAQKVIDGAYSQTQYVASFAGFAPVQAPRLVGLVTIDEPTGRAYHGGTAAAPVFRRIFADALKHLRVPRDDQFLTVSPQLDAPRYAAAGAPERRGDGYAADTVPDLAGMTLREAVARLAARGFHAEARGSGVVVAQSPLAGAALSTGQVCRIRLEDTLRETWISQAAGARPSRR